MWLLSSLRRLICCCVTIDSKLSWSKHIDSMAAKMGSGLSVIGSWSAFLFLTSQSTRQVLQAYYPAVWSCAAKKDMGKLQLAQNKVACITLRCTRRESVSNMYVSLSWLKVEERLTASLFVFVRGIDVLKVPNCLFMQLAQSSDTRRYKTCNQKSLYIP